MLIIASSVAVSCLQLDVVTIAVNKVADSASPGCNCLIIKGEGEALDSCSIIVMSSNEVMKLIHERMPAIVELTSYGYWLDTRITDKKIMGHLNSASLGSVRIDPVSTWVNTPFQAAPAY